MSTIRTTISEALSDSGLSHYAASAGPVIEALVEREEQIKSDLTEFAVGKGLRESEVEALFIEVGLSETPEPEALVSGEGQSVEAMVASLSEQIKSLSDRLDRAAQAASRHGVRF